METLKIHETSHRSEGSLLELPDSVTVTHSGWEPMPSPYAHLVRRVALGDEAVADQFAQYADEAIEWAEASAGIAREAWLSE